VANVLVLAPGSRGDVGPVAGVGARLRAGGHRVTVAADREFAGLLTGAGLEFTPLAGDIRAAAGSDLHRDAARDGAMSRSTVRILRAAKDYFRFLNRDIARVTAASGADVVLTGPWSTAALTVAEAKGIPTLGLYLQPQEPTAELPPFVFGRSLGRFGNRVTGSVVRKLEGMYFTGIDEIRAEHGLPPTTRAAHRRALAERNWPVLHGFSPLVVPRPADWRTGLEVVGYWWPPVPADWTPPDELSRFLDAGPAPVFVGLGSTNPGDAERVSRTVAAALRAAGKRGIVQAGWAELSTTDDHVLGIGDVPHEWLFPRCAAVVHAAGAGTTAAGLRAGVPAVPIPVTGDGPFWSWRLTELGASPGPIRFRKLTADGLAGKIRCATTDPGYAERAAAVAAGLAAEDGAAAVLAAVDRLVR
jgi:sterol 3beta-glucosyltransferase